MTSMLALPKHLGLRFCGLLAACILAATTLAAQKPVARIQSEIAPGDTVPVKISTRPWAQPQYDAGRMAADARLTSMSIVFNRTAAQEADLNALLAAQQNPSSPLYHQWLTPEQYGARFGMAQSDLDKVETWLQQQGFSIDYVAHGKTYIQFSGSVGQIELAFQTQMHNYQVQGAKHFAPSTPLLVPAAIAPTIETIRGVSDFKPHAFHIPTSRNARPAYTFYGGSSWNVLFAPGDIKTAYDIKPLVSASIDGTGQSIAVMGQSEISDTDIENFESAAGLPTKDPTMILVPGSGSAAFSSGDESESDLDVEWSGAMAPGATIDFVYTGDSANSNGVFDSIQFAVDSKIGNIITVSYGACETDLNSFSLDSTFQQAATQGQSVIAASGDQGSTSCEGYPTTGTGALTTAQTLAAAVNYPASSAYVTGVGGTEITSANDAPGTYWSQPSSQSSITLTSALSYIPEVAWNDDASSGTVSPANGGGLSASGGGESTLYTSQPSWQKSYFTATGETNPSSTHRLVPDVALYASPELPGYLYCSSDETAWAPNQEGSCGAGQFYDSVSQYFTVAGGTSFGAPIFAGMVALINQKNKYADGQGFLNTELYSLASNSTTYASAFHDVKTGNNDCTAGTTYGYCASNGSSIGFSAGTGYDMVTGLGSVDLNNLVTAWPTSTSALVASTTTVSATNSSPTSGASDEFTITVAPAASAGTPTGTVTLSIDGGGTTFDNGGSTTSLTLGSGGTVTYTTSFSSAGVHTIVAEYAGDSTFAASTGSASITISGTSSGKGTFALAATDITVGAGSVGSTAVTVTPSGGYTGTVGFQVTSTSSALNDACYTAPNAVVTGTAAVTASISINTSYTSCAAGSVRGSIHKIGSSGSLRSSTSPSRPGARNILPAALAALFGFVLVGSRRRSKWLNMIGCLLLLGCIGLAVGCGGGGGGTTTSSNVPKGTYTLTVTGTDTVTSSITSSTTFTLTVD
ncbi:MAG TPA: protease pro-enzyme activation domain-containing protein [Terracidiphilus sp.]|nr:protease pro-enzyme activation domain-containing protein [Terracidiphilus sp.]